MPKSTKHNKTKNNKVVHPNSRKAAKIGKKVIHWEKVNNVHNRTALKHSLVRDKLLWVKDYIAEDEKVSYSREDLCHIVESYLKRFDEEKEQISIIKGIASRRNNQHASRAAAINLTLSKEKTDYETCGIELPDLCNGRNLKLFLAWDGELRYLQRIKLRRVKKVEQRREETGNDDDDDGANNDVDEDGDSDDDGGDKDEDCEQTDRQEELIAGGIEGVGTGDTNHVEESDDDTHEDDSSHDDDTVLDVFDEELDDGSEKT